MIKRKIMEVLRKRRGASNKGFTLVELIVVMAVLAIIAVMLLPNFTKVITKARNTVVLNNARNVVEAVQIAAQDAYVNEELVVYYAGTSGLTATADNPTTNLPATGSLSWKGIISAAGLNYAGTGTTVNGSSSSSSSSPTPAKNSIVTELRASIDLEARVTEVRVTFKNGKEVTYYGGKYTVN